MIDNIHKKIAKIFIKRTILFVIQVLDRFGFSRQFERALTYTMRLNQSRQFTFSRQFERALTYTVRLNQSRQSAIPETVGVSSAKINHVTNVHHRQENIHTQFSKLYQERAFEEAAWILNWVRAGDMMDYGYFAREVFEITDDKIGYEKFLLEKSGQSIELKKQLTCEEAADLESVEYTCIGEKETVTNPELLPGFPNGLSVEKGGCETYSQAGLLVKNCMVFPWSNVIITRESAVIHDLAAQRFSQEQNLILEAPIIGHFSEGVLVPKISKMSPKIYLKQAIHMLIGNARGFGHWHYMNLPRLQFIQSLNLPTDVPVLIDAGLPRQYAESIGIYLKGHPIIEVKRFDIVEVAELFFARQASPISSLLKASADTKIATANTTVSPRALGFLRQMARGHAKRSNAVHPNIYLSRRKTNRRLLKNREFLDELAYEHNFANICFEDLSFLDQISSSAFAKKAIAQLGSAADTIINLESGSKALICTTEHLKSWPKAHSVISGFGIDCRYLFGIADLEQSELTVNPEAHATANFLIKESSAEKAFAWLSANK